MKQQGNREMPENHSVERKLYNVTLDWEPGDDEQGDYATSVWALNEDEAIRLVAEEMADSSEVEHENDADRAAYIERVIEGAGQFAAELVADAVDRDLANLLSDRPDALQAIRAILNGQPALPETVQVEARKLPEMGLWVALAEHETEPGTQPALFAQLGEPGDAEILSRFSDDSSRHELKVVGVFDLSHLIKVDQASRNALDQYVRAMSTVSSAAPAADTPKTSSVFDTMVPWGLNRSPIGPSSNH